MSERFNDTCPKCGVPIYRARRVATQKIIMLDKEGEERYQFAMDGGVQAVVVYHEHQCPNKNGKGKGK